MKLLSLLILGVTLMFGAVDINTASKNELSGLHGIGAKKADAILAYRDANCFKSVNDLANVTGIGKKTLEKNRDNLTVSECKVKN